MREYKIYVCESCGYECKDAKEMKKHEAAHLGAYSRGSPEVQNFKRISKTCRGGCGTNKKRRNRK